MNFLKYLRFIPFLMQLIDFIKQAEAEYRSPDSGAQKLAFVQDQFIPLIQSAGAVGLLPLKLVAALVAGSGAIISIIVQFMNATGGIPVVPVLTPSVTDATGVPA